MGSTYSVGKAVSSVRAKDGTLYYALFEQTFESNVFPQTRTWSAIYFGTAEACLSRIITASACCEGGMLKGEGGDISPSRYLASWREAFAQPTRLQTTRVTGKIGSGVYAVPSTVRAQVDDILKAHGHPGIANEEISIDLTTHPAAMQALNDACIGASAWRFIPENQRGDERDETAAYAPATSKAALPPFRVYRLSGRGTRRTFEPSYWVGLHGELSGTGWAYSTVGNLIRVLATESERDIPGSAEDAMLQIKAAVQNAVGIPDDQPVTLTRLVQAEDYVLRRFDEVRAALALEGDVLSTTVGEFERKSTTYGLEELPDDMVEFPGLLASDSGLGSSDDAVVGSLAA